MKFDSSEAEKTFATLNLGVSTYVTNCFAQYEQLITELQEQIKLKDEELAKLKPKDEVQN